MPAKTGTVVRTTDPARLDAIVASGHDWLMLDGEHASVGAPEIEAMLRGVGGRVTCYVRVREPNATAVAHALGRGAHGIVFPNIDDARQAEHAVQMVRTSAWPMARVVVQAESAAAVRNIDQIVCVPGIEWVLIGPNDLSASLGTPGAFDHPAYTAAVHAIERACRTASVPVGIFGMTPERTQPYEARGHEWILIGIDRVT